MGGGQDFQNNAKKSFYDHNSFFTSNYTDEDMSERKNYSDITKRNFFDSIRKKSLSIFLPILGSKFDISTGTHMNGCLRGVQNVLQCS